MSDRPEFREGDRVVLRGVVDEKGGITGISGWQPDDSDAEYEQITGYAFCNTCARCVPAVKWMSHIDCDKESIYRRTTSPSDDTRERERRVIEAAKAWGATWLKTSGRSASPLLGKLLDAVNDLSPPHVHDFRCTGCGEVRG